MVFVNIQEMFPFPSCSMDMWVRPMQIQIPYMHALIKGHSPYHLEWQEFASIPDLAQSLFISN